MRLALLAGLGRNQETIQRNLERINDCEPGQGFYIPRTPLCRIYQSLLDRIGYLEPNDARAVYEAYAHIPLVQQQARLAVDLTRHRTPDGAVSIESDQFPIFPDQIPLVRHTIEVALEKTNLGIAALSGS